MPEMKRIMNNKGFMTGEFLLIFFLSIFLTAEAHAQGQDRVKVLIEKLHSKHANARALAVKELGVIKDPRVIDPLIAALKDPDSYVRGLAARQLGAIGDARSVPQLISLLRNDDFEYVRLEAARALGKIKDVRATQPLISALRDESREVREEATSSLIEIGKPAVEKLLRALKEKNPGSIAEAYYFFICLGEPDSEPLLIDSINRFGTKDMAYDFIQCGNPLLKESALNWAQRHHYKISERPDESGGPGWGRCRGRISSIK